MDCRMDNPELLVRWIRANRTPPNLLSLEDHDFIRSFERLPWPVADGIWRRDRLKRGLLACRYRNREMPGWRQRWPVGGLAEVI